MTAPAPPLITLPAIGARLAVCPTPQGLHLTILRPGEPPQEVTLEPHAALKLMRVAEKEYARR